MLSVTACITGRVISDLKDSERKLNKQFRELERTNQELDRFVYSASHDMSAPLKSLLGLINISRIEKDTQHHMDYINKMEVSIHKLENFISEILDYSKNSRTPIVADKIKIKDILSETLESLQLMENFEKVKIETSALYVEELLVDRIRLKIILNNLLMNAVKYNRYNEGHNPKITISSERNQQFIKIHIADNGQGMQKEVMDKIFTMFFRGNITSTGSGLGLYIAREAAYRMNGRIEVVSEYGLGSTFTVFVPIESAQQN